VNEVLEKLWIYLTVDFITKLPLVVGKNAILMLELKIVNVRCSSHQGGSPQNRLGDEQTCEMTLASAYMLCRLSAAWLQLWMLGRSLRWE